MNKSNEYFDWLDTIRKTGEFNIMAAPDVMAQKFNLTPEEARTIFWEWTQWLKANDNESDYSEKA